MKHVLVISNDGSKWLCDEQEEALVQISSHLALCSGCGRVLDARSDTSDTFTIRRI